MDAQLKFTTFFFFFYKVWDHFIRLNETRDFQKKKPSLKRQWCFMWIHQIVLASNIKSWMPTMPYKFLLHSATKIKIHFQNSHLVIVQSQMKMSTALSIVSILFLLLSGGHALRPYHCNIFPYLFCIYLV